jgi:spoIIIJ-associated protein
MIFQAKTLEEAYLKASEHFNCSVTEFESISVIQAPSSFLFGFIQKDAIVEIKYEKKVVVSNENEILKEEKIEVKEELKTSVEEEKEIKVETPNEEPISKKEEVAPNKNELINKIEKEINNLFNKSCFNLEKIKVSYFDNETLFIEFQGEDSALLIGKEGYRYNALSYMIFNWVNQKYGLKIRLEVAEFLQNQENMMNKLLSSTIEEIEARGKSKTKPFNGILIHIAVDILRERFPNKYVGVKYTKDGEKYIIVNEFLTKDE